MINGGDSNHRQQLITAVNLSQLLAWYFPHMSTAFDINDVFFHLLKYQETFHLVSEEMMTVMLQTQAEVKKLVFSELIFKRNLIWILSLD